MKAYIVSAILLTSCAACDVPPQQSTSSTSASTESTTQQPTLLQEVLSASSLSDAIRIARPYMGDKYNNELSGGGILLAEWMATHTFQIMWGKDETSPGKVFKDSQSELGKQICSVGTIVEIHAAHDEFNMEVGELMGFSGTLYHFYSVRGSGDLVHNSTAQICGFVVGTFNYSNSLGGTSHAVDIAAVWNLNYPPPNKSEDAAATLEQLLKVIRGVRDGSGPNRTTTN